MKEIVFSFGQDGAVRGMHRDEMSVGFLGKQKIERASDIRFDEQAQNWRIHLADGYDASGEQRFRLSPAVGGFASYNKARDFEVYWLNQCLKEQVDPLSDAGSVIGRDLYAVEEIVAGVAHA